MCPSDNKGNLPQTSHSEEFARNSAIARMKDHILALEIELAEYGSRYGFTERARELLARPVGD